MVVNFDISRESSIRAVEAAMDQAKMIFLVTQQDPEQDRPQAEGLYPIGIAAEVRTVTKMPKGIVRVMVEGMQRARLISMQEAKGYLAGEIELLEEEAYDLDRNTELAMQRALQDLLKRYAQMNQKFGKELLGALLELDALEELVEQVCARLPLHYQERQQLLEANGLLERYDCLYQIVTNEIEILQIRNEIQQKVRERVDKSQKEYILREQIKVIQEELGEDHVAHRMWKNINSRQRSWRLLMRLRRASSKKQTACVVSAATMRRIRFCAVILRHCWSFRGIKSPRTTGSEKCSTDY